MELCRSQDDVSYIPSWSREKQTLIVYFLVSKCQDNRWEVDDPLNSRSVISIVRFNAILHDGPSYNYPEEMYHVKYIEWFHRLHFFRWLVTCPFFNYEENLTPEVLHYAHEGPKLP